ncbi:MAG: glycosyltransferase, partial [Candidatus Omnitrophica bacterium]|nr:glycosyltransferase [Candidatus Omnitrophota bacterium]
KDKRFQIIFNKDNLGMANAINLALSTIAVEKWDYLWISDDDNIAEKNALKNLLDYANKNSILNPIILNQDKFTLAFKIKDLITNKEYETLNDVKKVEKINYLIPFNFTLFPREQIGFISEDYFIRGEEFDFITKKIIDGCRVYIIPKSIIYWLQKRETIFKNLLFLKIYQEMVTEKKLYYLVRNNLRLVFKFQKIVRNSSKRKYIENWFSYYKYNFFFFFFAYFFLETLIILLFYKNKIKNLKYLLLSYIHFIINKKGKI